ncbi:DUF500-domain-containing protein [Atractiella rhizophila]|nr:DUF500-domain-containing protein [Atractiella rhizophila]
MALPPPPKHVSHSRGQSTSSLTTTPGQSFWERTKAGGKSAWDGLYKVSDKVGFWSNKQAAKLGMEAFYPTNLEEESKKAARILRTFTDPGGIGPQALADEKKTQKVLKRIPQSAIANAQGLAIFTVFRSGFVLSGAGGAGIVIARREDGSWGGPSGILLHTVGFGFIFGVDVYDVVLILRTKKALETFIKPRVTIGGEVSVSAGPVGQGAMLESGIERSPVWSYVKSKGLYGGVQMDGNIMIERNDENARSYNRTVTAEEILTGKVPTPYWAEPLIQTILFSEGKPTATNLIPAAVSTAEMLEQVYGPPRKLPQEDEDEDDRRARQEMEEKMREFGIENGAEINRTRQSLDVNMERSGGSSNHSPSLYSQQEKIPEDVEVIFRKDSTLQTPESDYPPSESSRERFGSIVEDSGSEQMHYLKAFDQEPEMPPASPASATFEQTPTTAAPPVPKRRSVPPPLPGRSATRNSADLGGPSTPTTKDVKEKEESDEALPSYEDGEAKEVAPEKGQVKEDEKKE